ncbi:MAG: hypothetical protein IJW09_00655 [Clostridia bacterium]|nr:hypothetical protein [Clostridia bacterium]
MPTYDFSQVTVRVKCPRDVGTIRKITCKYALLSLTSRMFITAECEDWLTHRQTGSCTRCSRFVLDTLRQTCADGIDYTVPQPLDPNA